VGGVFGIANVMQPTAKSGQVDVQTEQERDEDHDLTEAERNVTGADIGVQTDEEVEAAEQAEAKKEAEAKAKKEAKKKAEAEARSKKKVKKKNRGEPKPDVVVEKGEDLTNEQVETLLKKAGAVEEKANADDSGDTTEHGAGTTEAEAATEGEPTPTESGQEEATEEAASEVWWVQDEQEDGPPKTVAEARERVAKWETRQKEAAEEEGNNPDQDSWSEKYKVARKQHNDAKGELRALEKAENKNYTLGKAGREMAEKAGLTLEDLKDAARDKQGRITKAGIEQTARKRDRDAANEDLSPELQEVLGFIDDTLTKTGDYNTGRTRKGTLQDKINTVDALAKMLARLNNTSTAPDDVRARAGELAGKYKEIGQASDEQAKGKGFTATLKGPVLDPLIDEMTELAKALERGKPAPEGTVQQPTPDTDKKEPKVSNKRKRLKTSDIAEAKARQAKTRDELIAAREAVLKVSNIEKREALLADVNRRLEEEATERAAFDEEANYVEKEKDKTADEKRKAVGDEFKAGKVNNVKQARTLLAKLGVPEYATEAAKKVKDLVVNPNNYPLAVHVIQRRGDEFAAEAKDVLTSTDAELGPTRALLAGKMGELGFPADVIEDVVEFAEALRGKVQEEVRRAEATTEEIREIAAEEDFGVTAADLAEQGLEDLATNEDTGAYYNPSEIALSDEYDPHAEDGSEDFGAERAEEQYEGDVYSADWNRADPKQKVTPEVRNTIIRMMVETGKMVKPKPWTQKMFKRDKKLRKAEEEVGNFILNEYGESQEFVYELSDVIYDIWEKLPNKHPYKSLLSTLSHVGVPDAIFDWDSDMGPHAFHGLTGRTQPDDQGFYHTAKPHVVIGTGVPADQLVRVIVHETIHHYAVLATTQNSAATVYLDELRIRALEAIEEAGVFGDAAATTAQLKGYLYGLTNVDEFLAEAFSNPMFQDLLRHIPADPTPLFGKQPSTMKSLWDNFLGILKKTLGMPAIKNSVLDEVISHGTTLFHDPAMYTEDGGAFVGMNNRMQVISDDKEFMGMREVTRDGKTTQREHVQFVQQIEDNAVAALGEQSRGFARGAADAYLGKDPILTNNLRNGSPAAQERLANSWATKFKAPLKTTRMWAAKVSLGMQTMDQINRNYDRMFKGKLSAYNKIMRQRNRIAQRWQNRGAAIDELAIKVEKAGNDERYGEFVTDVSMAEVHPDYDWKYQKMKFNRRERPAAEKRWKEMNRRWRKELSRAERELFKAQRDFFAAQRKELTDSSLKNLALSMPGINESLALDVYKAVKRAGSVEALQNGTDDVAAALQQHDHVAKSMEKVLRAGKVRGAYFPLRRFGDFVVSYKRNRDLGTFRTRKDANAALADWRAEHPGNVANSKTAIKKNAAGQYTVAVTEEGVEFFENEAEADASLAELHSKGWKTPTGVTRKENWGGKFDVGSTIILNQAKKKFGDMTVEEAERFQSILDSAFIELLAESNVRKSELQRKNTRGASTDARRVFAERVFAGSYALADMEMIFDQTKAMQALRDASRSSTDTGNNVKRGYIVEELALRESHTVNDRTANPIADWVAQLGFLGFLAGPSYPVINATQPFLVGLPWLGARYGFKATPALMANFESMLAQVSKEIVDSRAGVKRNPHQAVQNVINALEKEGRGGTADALRAMRDMGVMDSTFIDAISEAAKAKQYNPSSWTIFKFAASFPKVVEVLNRSVMAATAYELEMKKSGDKAKATEVAGEAILQTQFDYSDFNKPRYFKGKVTRPLLLFKMYPQGIYALLASSVKQMTNGQSLEVRKQGFNTLLGLAAAHTVVGGALGGIFMEPVRALLAAMEGLFGDEDDEEYFPFFDKQQFDINMRQFAYDFLGDKKLAEVVMRGLPRAVGVDLSQRVGLHNLMLMGLQDKGQGDNLVFKTVEALGGAPVAALMSWDRARRYIMSGQYQRGIEAGAPKAIRDVMGTIRLANDGLQDFKGKTFARPEQFDAWDYFIKVGGFAPSEVSELYSKRYAQKNYERKMNDRRNLLIDEWIRGTATPADILKWNAKHPDWFITAGDYTNRFTRRLMDEVMTDETGYPINIKRPSIKRQARY
jgi:hypothetical protein